VLILRYLRRRASILGRSSVPSYTQVDLADAETRDSMRVTICVGAADNPASFEATVSWLSVRHWADVCLVAYLDDITSLAT